MFSQIAIGTCARAQLVGVEDIGRHVFKNMECQSVFSPFETIGESKTIVWEEVGPFSKPVEGPVGGKAIPNYASGRGNGTGRVNGLFVHPKHQSTLYACSATGGLFVSHNKGFNWQIAGTDGLKQAGVGALAVHARRRDWWIIATGDGENEWAECDELLFTADGGKHYQSIIGSNSATCLPLGNNKIVENNAFYIRKIVLDPISDHRIWVVSNQGLWLCDNFYVNRKGNLMEQPRWKRVCEGQFFDLLYTKMGAEVEWFLSGTTLMRSADDGYHWSLMTEGGLDRSIFLDHMRMTIFAHRNLPNFLYVSITSSANADGTNNGTSGLYLVDTKKENWQPIHNSAQDGIGPSNIRPRAIAIHPNDPNRIITSNVQPVYFSSDGGKSFKKSVGNLMHDDVHQLVFANNGQMIYAAHDGGISMSKDGGLHWADRSVGLACANVFGLDVSADGKGQIIYGAFDTGINLVTDSSHTHLIWGDGFDCAFLPSKQGMLATIQDGLFFKSAQHQTFEAGKQPNSKSEWKSNMAVHPLDQQCVLMAGKRLMRSLDGGDSWQPIYDVQRDSSMLTVFDVFLSDFSKNTGIAYVLSAKDIRKGRLFYSQSINESDPQRVQWTELPALPVPGIVVSILFHPVARHQFWVLYSNVSEQGKLWFFDGHAYTDVSANLGSARCESMIFNTSKFMMIIGSEQGLFCRTLHESVFQRYTGYPGCTVKCMDIDYRNQNLYIGTFGRGIWRCPLSNFESHK